MNTYVTAGIDLGNGYVKAYVDGFVQSFPSVAAKQVNTRNNVALGDEEIPGFMGNIVNMMDLSFSSPLVNATERRLFGDRALRSGLSYEEFDVFSRKSKAEVDLSGVLALATLASHALVQYYEKHRTLPTTALDIKVDLATALPINEFRNHSASYRERFLNNGEKHTVTFHNFKHPVRIDLTFENVYVANEGESAQYGLMFAQGPFLDMIRDEAVKRFPNGELDGITGADIVQAKNTLGIDIGEGTTDYAVFSDGRFNADSSSTMNEGYGKVLEMTLSTLQDEGYPYKSRKELAEFLHTTPSAFSKTKWNHVKSVNEAEERRFAGVLANEVSKVFARVGTFTEVIFVFGGGASPLEHAFFTALQERVSEFGSDTLLPIVYLDSKFSRYLNVQGLYQVAKRIRPESERALEV